MFCEENDMDVDISQLGDNLENLNIAMDSERKLLFKSPKNVCPWKRKIEDIEMDEGQTSRRKSQPKRIKTLVIDEQTPVSSKEVRYRAANMVCRRLKRVLLHPESSSSSYQPKQSIGKNIPNSKKPPTKTRRSLQF